MSEQRSSGQRSSTQPDSNVSLKLDTDGNSLSREEDRELSIDESPLSAFRELLISSFSDVEFKEALLFEDTLVGEDGCGEYRVSVAESLWNGKTCFIVEGSSNGFSDGVRWKLQLNATVEIPSLGTVRQKHIFTTESCVEEGVEEDDPLDVVECLTTVEMLKRPFTPVEEPPPPDDDGEGEEEELAPPMMGGEDENEAEVVEEPMHVTYRVTNTLKHHDDKEEAEMVLSEEDSAKFFPAGALVILLRCLTKLYYENQSSNQSIIAELVDIDPDFQLCPLFCFLEDQIGGPEDDSANESKETTLRFRLDHHRSDGVIYRVSTDHLESGQVVRRKQDDPVATFCRRVEDRVEDDEESGSLMIPEKPEFPKKELMIEEDSELFSKYDDRKVELKASHASYIREHPELKTLMADFLQEVLTMRPEPFLPFAANYFAAYRQTESSRMTSRTSKFRASRAASTVPSNVVSEICVCEDPEPEW